MVLIVLVDSIRRVFHATIAFRDVALVHRMSFAVAHASFLAMRRQIVSVKKYD
jgi:hypothetical protein